MAEKKMTAPVLAHRDGQRRSSIQSEIPVDIKILYDLREDKRQPCVKEEIVLTADELPKHDFGVGIYGGYWPDGVAVKNPCCKCKRFGQCKSTRVGNRSGRDCFIERGDQRRQEVE